MDEKNKEAASILGLSTSELAGLSVQDLTGNETAIKMLVHYYKQLQNENQTFRNEVNTLKTYVSAYDTTKSNAASGAILLAVSNIPLGLGINLLGNPQAVSSGWASIVIGVALIASGIFFSFFKDRR